MLKSIYKLYVFLIPFHLFLNFKGWFDDGIMLSHISTIIMLVGLILSLGLKIDYKNYSKWFKLSAAESLQLF